MPKQFAYRDAHGTIYPAHAALAFQPGLVPGQYDTDTKRFTPTGNPLQQTGTIITDAGGGAHQTVMSGLSEDGGADTAPIKAGVAFTQRNDAADVAEIQARNVELESQLSESNERNAALQAQIATLTDQLAAAMRDPIALGVGGVATGAESGAVTDDAAAQDAAQAADGAPQTDAAETETTPVKRARKASS